jgi:tRNA modification GTPase
VIRLSGSRVRDVAVAISGALPEPRHAVLRDFRDASGELIDCGLALFFPAPHSYTGEDVLELHAHGGPAICEQLIGRAVQLGCRIAWPGEFTERAFLNDKLDLAQAEAVADLIEASSVTAARAAQRSLRGDFSAAVERLIGLVTELRIYVEASIDFPDDDIDFLATDELHVRLAAVQEALAGLEETARQGCLMKDGVRIVILGRPNVGKSSLLNALAGYPVAIVGAMPGTTRDIVREELQIDGMPLHVVDTAGLRPTMDEVEAEGIRRALGEARRSDHALLVIDAREPIDTAQAAVLSELPAGLDYTLILNKIDLTSVPAGLRAGESATLCVSALTGAGLPELRQRLRNAAGLQPTGEGAMTARGRHLEALRRAGRHLDVAVRQLQDHSAELVAEELTQVQNVLGEITGEVTSDELLGKIFESFCVGK